MSRKCCTNFCNGICYTKGQVVKCKGYEKNVNVELWKDYERNVDVELRKGYEKNVDVELDINTYIMLECRCAFEGELTIIIFSDGKLLKENYWERNPPAYHAYMQTDSIIIPATC